MTHSSGGGPLRQGRGGVRAARRPSGLPPTAHRFSSAQVGIPRGAVASTFGGTKYDSPGDRYLLQGIELTGPSPGSLRTLCFALAAGAHIGGDNGFGRTGADGGATHLR